MHPLGPITIFLYRLKARSAAGSEPSSHLPSLQPEDREISFTFKCLPVSLALEGMDRCPQEWLPPFLYRHSPLPQVHGDARPSGSWHQEKACDRREPQRSVTLRSDLSDKECLCSAVPSSLFLLLLWKYSHLLFKTFYNFVYCTKKKKTKNFKFYAIHGVTKSRSRQSD